MPGAECRLLDEYQPMPHSLKIGQRVPPVTLGELFDGHVQRVPLERVLAGRRSVVFGVAGAYTPICSQRHAPEFIEKAKALKASGFDQIICIGPNDPWTMAAWGDGMDPDGQLRYLSDGNMDFANKTGLIERHEDYFLGDRLKRFVMIVQDAVVEHIGIETNLLTLSCSRAEDVFLTV